MGAKKSRRRAGSESVVTATDAAKNFGEIVDAVRESRVAYVVERKGRPIARIAPLEMERPSLSDLVRWFRARPSPPEEYTAAVLRHVKAANRLRVPAARWEP